MKERSPLGKQVPRQTKSGARLWLVIGAAVVVVSGLIGLSVASNQKATDTSKNANLVAEGNTRGQKTAKVEVVEYGDFY